MSPIEKKYRVSLAWLMVLLANVSCGGGILPILQHRENAHMSDKNFVTVVFIVAAFAVLGFSLAHAQKKKENALVWPAAAFVGVVLLTEPWQASVDLVGVAFALGAGACWGLYNVLTQHVGDRFSGITGLSLTIPVAALATLPVGLPQVVGGDLAWWVLPAAAGIALITPVIAFGLEMLALRRMTHTPRRYSAVPSPTTARPTPLPDQPHSSPPSVGAGGSGPPSSSSSGVRRTFSPTGVGVRDRATARPIVAAMMNSSVSASRANPAPRATIRRRCATPRVPRAIRATTFATTRRP